MSLKQQYLLILETDSKEPTMSQQQHVKGQELFADDDGLQERAKNG